MRGTPFLLSRIPVLTIHVLWKPYHRHHLRRHHHYHRHHHRHHLSILYFGDLNSLCRFWLRDCNVFFINIFWMVTCSHSMSSVLKFFFCHCYRINNCRVWKRSRGPPLFCRSSVFQYAVAIFFIVCSKTNAVLPSFSFFFHNFLLKYCCFIKSMIMNVYGCP